MNIISNIFKFSLLLFCGECLSASLSYNEVSKGEFELILEHDVPLEIPQARAAIYQSAVQLCNGKTPTYGKYKINNQDLISTNSGSSLFYFSQMISCGDSSVYVEE